MPASKRSTPSGSAEGIGKTDLARLDAHVVQAEEYDDLPELTDEMVARSVSGDGAGLVRRGRGRPVLENPKQRVTLRVDADVLGAYKATGKGWQTRINDTLRAGASGVYQVVGSRGDKKQTFNAAPEGASLPKPAKRGRNKDVA